MTPEIARWAGALGLTILGVACLWASRRLVLAKHPGGVLLAPAGAASLTAAAASVAILTGHNGPVPSWTLLLAILPVDLLLAWFVVRHAVAASRRQHEVAQVAQVWGEDG